MSKSGNIKETVGFELQFLLILAHSWPNSYTNPNVTSSICYVASGYQKLAKYGLVCVISNTNKQLFYILDFNNVVMTNFLNSF